MTAVYATDGYLQRAFSHCARSSPTAEADSALARSPAKPQLHNPLPLHPLVAAHHSLPPSPYLPLPPPLSPTPIHPPIITRHSSPHPPESPPFPPFVMAGHSLLREPFIVTRHSSLMFCRSFGRMFNCC